MKKRKAVKESTNMTMVMCTLESGETTCFMVMALISLLTANCSKDSSEKDKAIKELIIIKMVTNIVVSFQML